MNKIGKIVFGLDELKIKEIKIPIENVTITFQDQLLNIEM